MRNAVGIFGLAAGAIVVALVGRYGYATSDTPLDGIIAAFFFAVIALGGIAGPAVAVHVFKTRPGWGLVSGLVSVIALVANLTNSLGAIASRGDKLAASRTQAANAQRDDRAELARLVREREAVGTFTPATADAVAAARAAVTAAERTTHAECAARGKRCRERETEEAARRSQLATVLANRAATERAATLDADLVAVRGRLASAPAVGAINPLADALGRILHIEAAVAATAQQIAVVTVVELLIALSLIAAEVLPKSGPPTAAQIEVARPLPRTQKGAPAARIASREAGSRALPGAARAVTALPAPTDATTVLAKWATEALRPAERSYLPLAGLHAGYAVWAKARGFEALQAESFRAVFLAMVQTSGFAVRSGKVRGLAKV